MRYLSVGGIFKNEGHALREWCAHYFYHGAEHIYLIDDGSTDGGSETITDYVERGSVTIFREDDHPYYQGRQRVLYNRYVLPHIKQTYWLLIVDLDEFMWSPRSIDMRPVLSNLEHVAQVQITHTIFGSNGHIQTPSAIVPSYTRRCSQIQSQDPKQEKYFINSALVDVQILRVHWADFQSKYSTNSPYYLMDDNWFILNHYACQSEQFWREVKCTRGSANAWKVDTPGRFAIWDRNDVEDTRLLEQNRPILFS